MLIALGGNFVMKGGFINRLVIALGLMMGNMEKLKPSGA